MWIHTTAHSIHTAEKRPVSIPQKMNSTPEAREKKRLIEDITLTLEDIVGSMKRLNMNMEQLIEVSNDTARIAEVWNQFFTKLQEKNQAV